MYRMSSGYASVLVNTLSAQGLDVASLCQEAGLDMKLADKPGAFCERRAIYRLWELAAQASGDPDIGLKAYGNFHPGSFQIVGYTMMSSLNLKKALERLVRFSPLIGTGFSLFFITGTAALPNVRRSIINKKARSNLASTPMQGWLHCWVSAVGWRAATHRNP